MMTNAEIYELNNRLNSVFQNETRYLPAKVNYFIIKNKAVISNLATEIEEARGNVIIQYGELEDPATGQYTFTEESRLKANQELADLLNIEQEVQISKVKIDDLEGLEFTPQQMQALLFMIEE